jgi:sigma-54 specific flagellar transcriptional regulator A
MVSTGHFREDLYYRISVIPVEIPPLRQRTEDIPLLVDYFVDRWVKEERGESVRFSVPVMETFRRYPWPGNIRELENLVERFLVLKSGEMVHPEDLPEKFSQSAPPIDDSADGVAASPEYFQGGMIPSISSGGDMASAFGEIISNTAEHIDLSNMLAEIERDLIEKALLKFGGNKTKASDFLGMNRTTLIEKLKRLRPGIPQDFPEMDG